MFWFQNLISISLEQGLVYCLATVGVAISFRLLHFPDLTVDGSFALGGAVGAAALAAGQSPLASLILVLFAGLLAGAFTASLHNWLGISRLLAGILTMTMLYSVNLRTMGRSNVSLLDVTTLLTWAEINWPAWFPRLALIAFLAVVLAGVLLLVRIFLATEFGAYLRATGENIQVVKSLGMNSKLFILVGLALSNMFVSLSGFIVAQKQGFADVSMGLGLIISSLAALVIGESLVRPKSLSSLLAAIVLGSVLYQVCLGVGLRLGLAASDLKMVTGLLVVAVLFTEHALGSKPEQWSGLNPPSGEAF